MNKVNIVKSANYNLISEYLGIKKETIKDWFKRYKKDVSDPDHVGDYIDKHMHNRGGIYIIENIVNGRRYIGQSNNLYNRIKAHKTNLKKGNHPNKDLQIDYDNNGKSCFVYNIHCFSNSLEERTELEEHLVSVYGMSNCYNSISRNQLAKKYGCEEVRKLVLYVGKVKELLKTLD